MLDIDGRRSKFSDTLSDSAKSLFSVTFNSFEDYEASIGSYIEDMTDEEFSKAIELTVKKSSRTNAQRRSVIRRYLTWCKENGYKCREHKGFDLSGENDNAKLSVIKSSMFASPAHLHNFLNEIFDPVELGSTDVLYRCFIWLVYSGLTTKEIETVRIEDVDIFNFSIRMRSTEYKLPAESLASIHACMTLDSFLIRSERVYDRVYHMRRADSRDLLRRAVKSTRVSYSRLRIDTSKKVHSKGYSIELDGIRKSGDYYRVFQREQITGEADLSMLVMRSIESDPKFQEKRTDLQKKSVRSIRNYIQKDYNAWKSAFNMK